MWFTILTNSAVQGNRPTRAKNKCARVQDGKMGVHNDKEIKLTKINKNKLKIKQCAP